MPSAASPNPRAGSAQPDEFDRLLDYDDAVEDFLRDIPVGNNDQNNADTTADQPRDEDQEVQVKKKRKPVPKLDENLLLSQNGIPKLRKITKTRLKFRGKGHEFSDISRLMNTYQLWLDDLYPRAKFRDALTMVEKVGHSKRMQVMRRQWLDDTKPNRRDASPDVEMSGANGTGQEPAGEARGERESSLFGDVPEDRPAQTPSGQHAGGGDAPEDDELDAHLAANGNSSVPREKPQQKPSGPFGEEDEPDDDELDALLAESGNATSTKSAGQQSLTGPFGEEPDEDELDAMIAEQPTAQLTTGAPAERIAGAQHQESQDDFADDEEAMASMGGMW